MLTGTTFADVDWYLLWGGIDRIPYDFQSEELNDCWYCSCLHHVLAVSTISMSYVLEHGPLMKYSRETSFTYFPDNEIGNDRWNFFKKVVSFHPISTLNVLDWDVRETPSQFALALFTFLYVDIIDCTATLYSMARFSGVVDPDTGDFPRSTLAYCTDAFSISVGALFGVSPVTAFIESGAGIAEGGKTGLTAMTCGTCFFISMFFAPIFASIPPWATGSCLVLVSRTLSLVRRGINHLQVGCLMMRQVVAINWRYIGDAVPAFVTVMFIPFGYSAAYGLIAGLMTYAALNGMIYVTKLVTRGYLVPEDEDHREYWTSKFSPRKMQASFGLKPLFQSNRLENCHGSLRPVKRLLHILSTDPRRSTTLHQ